MRLLWLLAACSAGDALVVVSVSSSAPLIGLTALHATVDAAGHEKAFDVSYADGGSFDIPPERTFAVEIVEAFTGAFTITVDAGGVAGSASTTTSPGQRSDVAIRLANADMSP